MMTNDKTPLELAREMLTECSGPNCTVTRCRVAAALIERETPVEVSTPDEHLARCGACSAWVERGDNYCPDCGKRITWK